MQIIKISAMWCPSCLIMNDLISDLIDSSKYKLVSYDFDLDQDVISKFNVGTILPVLIKLDSDGKVNALDYIVIRKIILGIDTSFSGNGKKIKGQTAEAICPILSESEY